jgi:hypothetical protein
MWPYHECVVDVSEPFSRFVGITWRQRQNPVPEMLFSKINRMVLLDKDRRMDNVQKHNIHTNVQSQTFRSYIFYNYTIWSKVSGHPLETVIRISLWHTSQSWTLIPGGPTLCLYDSSYLNISGGMAAHSSCRAVARVLVMWGIGLWSEVGVLWDSGQDSGLASPFLEHYCLQIIPSQTLIYGREHCHADTDNRHHRTGLLLYTVCNRSKCPCILPHLYFRAVLREGQVHSMKNTPTL